MSVSLSELNQSRTGTSKRRKRKGVVNLAQEYGQESTRKELEVKGEEYSLSDESASGEVSLGVDQLKDIYEKEIAELRLSIAEIKKEKRPLNVNEVKLINAIRSETLNQDREDPIITRSMFLKKFKINSKYLDSSIRSICERGLVKKTQIPYTTNIMTNSWELI